MLLWGLASLFAGAGMLRRSPGAYTVAIACQAFGLLNVIFTFAFGSAAIKEIIQQASNNQAVSDFVSSFVWLGTLFGFLYPVVFLWFLVTGRQAYLRACNLQLDSSAMSS